MNYSGIYLIEGPSGRFYGGSSVSIRNRWYDHKYAVNNGSTKLPHLYAAMCKYGFDSFTIRPLIRCDKNLLEEYEQRWLDKNYGTDGCLNASASAKAPMRNASKETLRKLSKAISKAVRGRLAWNRGIPRTEKEKEAIRKGTFANPNAHRPKLSEKQKQEVVKLYFDKGLFIRQIADQYRVAGTTIRKVLVQDVRYESIAHSRKVARAGWNSGRPHTPETRRRISKAKRRNS